MKPYASTLNNFTPFWMNLLCMSFSEEKLYFSWNKKSIAQVCKKFNVQSENHYRYAYAMQQFNRIVTINDKLF